MDVDGVEYLALLFDRDEDDNYSRKWNSRIPMNGDKVVAASAVCCLLFHLKFLGATNATANATVFKRLAVCQLTHPTQVLLCISIHNLLWSCWL